ncbi:origin recognition complex subunit 1 isoform X2 [Xiphophorus couchianus]|uniref:origin recognition complex subunit 1 isoform X2 n=1 Tax=Xiphophorus couchianus TaxID=32473 RepID=UPI001016A9D5|nr:origin recognition complex subunit 1 isoform X2 [Xiphophorus couchianus]
MKYFTRLRVRRVYEWRGAALGFNRKLQTYEYGSLSIRVEGLPHSTVISAGQHILIEGDDDDNPYVARVVRLFADESGAQKKAVVQWYVRVSEVPPGKLKLLGRNPHPQEVFFYEGRSCEDEVNAESVLRPVQVRHVDAAAPFPVSEDGDIFYVKLSWDSRTFRPVDPSLLDAPRPPCPSLPLSPPSSPLAAAPAPGGPARRALPTPDPAVMRGAMATPASSRKPGAEAESLHSLTKLSASKCLSAKRRSATCRTPGVRKKLQLSSPDDPAALRDDVLQQLLEAELEKGRRSAATASPSEPLHITHSLTPLRRTSRTPGRHDNFPLTPCSVRRRESQSETDSPPAGDDLSSPQLESSSSRRRVALGRNHATFRETTSTRRKEVQTGTEPVLEVLDEEEEKNGALRIPRRKSALKVSSRIRKQLNLLDDRLSSDEDEEEEEFVPSRKELQSDEEEDDEGDEEEDEELEVKKSRRSSSSAVSRTKQRTSARTPRKTPRKAGPKTPRTHHHATPSIPNRAQPARRPGNILEEARARLHVSAVPESLPCREQEFQDIYSFVESKVLDGTGGCMYVSGVPGTGKTATVQEVMRCLQHAAEQDEIPPFVFIQINGMKMTDPHQAYAQILQKLTGQKATADHAAALLEKRFSHPAPRKETTVLLVDELDLLWTRKQNVMYNLFDWPTRRHARLVVLAIANTMDLPERILINRVASRLGLTRMSFQPYSFKQLQQIVTSRLNKLKAFEDDALQIVSRKVAALSGDARRCLDICRRATEICERSAARLVGMSHVMQALDEMFSSPYVAAIRSASTQEQLFLRAVIAEFRRLGLEEATFQQVLVQHQALCRVEGLQPVGVSEGLAACRRLGACRLLLLEPSCLGVLQRVRLNVSQDDVLFALKAD